MLQVFFKRPLLWTCCKYSSRLINSSCSLNLRHLYAIAVLLSLRLFHDVIYLIYSCFFSEISEVEEGHLNNHQTFHRSVFVCPRSGHCHFSDTSDRTIPTQNSIPLRLLLATFCGKLLGLSQSHLFKLLVVLSTATEHRRGDYVTAHIGWENWEGLRNRRDPTPESDCPVHVSQYCKQLELGQK